MSLVSKLFDPLASYARSWGVDPVVTRRVRDVGLGFGVLAMLVSCGGSGPGSNLSPRITSFSVPDHVVSGSEFETSVEATDPDGVVSRAVFGYDGRTIEDVAAPFEARFFASSVGSSDLEVIVYDDRGATAFDSRSIEVVEGVLPYAEQVLPRDVFDLARDALSGLDPSDRDLVDVIREVYDYNASRGQSGDELVRSAASYAGLARSGRFEQFEREVVSEYREGTQDRGIVMPRADELEPWYWPIANKPGDGTGVVTLTGFPDNIRLDGDDMTWRELAWELEYGEDFEDCNIGNDQTDFNLSRSRLDELFDGRYPVYAYASGEFVQVDTTGQPGGDIGITVRVEPNDITPATVYDQNHLVELAPGVERGARVERRQLLGYINMNLNATDTLMLDTGITIPKSVLPIGTDELQRPGEDVEVFHAPFPNAWLIQQYAPTNDPTQWAPHRTGYSLVGASSSNIDVNNPDSWENATWLPNCNYPSD